MLKLKIYIKQSFKSLVILFLVSLIVSCAITEANITTIAKQSKFKQSIVKQQLLKLKNWQISGVMGIIYNDKAESASYTYSQNADKFKIKLYGPLGIGGVEIEGDSNQVSLENSKGERIEAKDAKALMLNQLGWYVPIEGLKFWVKAIAIPNVKNYYKLNDNNLVEQLSQNGWNISYKRYKLVDNKYPLPSSIRMSRDNLTIKIVIKSWQI